MTFVPQRVISRQIRPRERAGQVPLPLPRLRHCLIVAGATAVIVVVLLASALSAEAKPPTDTSFYWTTTNTETAEDDGCTQGILDSHRKQ
jgi:hypothetical protein